MQVNMCEGPEVFALAQALEALGFDAHSYGTHIFLKDLPEDWGFTPRACGMSFEDDGCLSTASLQGVFRCSVRSVLELAEVNKLGTDWMRATSEDVLKAVSKWSKSRKPLGALLASQYDIAGIGSAWGSEACHQAFVLPNEPANEQDLGLLADALDLVRGTAVDAYQEALAAASCTGKSATAFVEEWPLSLQAARSKVMQVYGCGNPVAVNAYKWWV